MPEETGRFVQTWTAGLGISGLGVKIEFRDAVGVHWRTNDRGGMPLLWNFTVLGEAAGQVSEEVKERFPDIAWQQPQRLRNRIMHGYWSIDLAVPHPDRHRATACFRRQPAPSTHRPR
jgi:Ribonuclease HepT-like